MGGDIPQVSQVAEGLQFFLQLEFLSVQGQLPDVDLHQLGGEWGLLGVAVVGEVGHERLKL
jgi:hypothetical protein